MRASLKKHLQCWALKNVKKFRYSKERLVFLRTGYQSMNARDLATAFNTRFGTKKTEGSIKAALKNHKIRCGRLPKDRLVNRFRLFSDDQVTFLKDNYPGRNVAELRKLFNAKFGTDMTWQQIKTAVSNRGITSGRTGHFPKGHKPWNNGTKGQGLTGANKRSFKKGSVPPNRRPIGSERICPKDGYVLIKVKERNPHTGFPTRWKHKHAHVWEQEHGPVPDGHCLIFKDGDKTNCEDINNVLLVSRAELLRLNKYGYKDAPAEIKPSILATVKLEVKTFSVERESL